MSMASDDANRFLLGTETSKGPNVILVLLKLLLLQLVVQPTVAAPSSLHEKLKEQDRRQHAEAREDSSDRGQAWSPCSCSVSPDEPQTSPSRKNHGGKNAPLPAEGLPRTSANSAEGNMDRGVASVVVSGILVETGAVEAAEVDAVKLWRLMPLPAISGPPTGAGVQPANNSVLSPVSTTTAPASGANRHRFRRRDPRDGCKPQRAQRRIRSVTSNLATPSAQVLASQTDVDSQGAIVSAVSQCKEALMALIVAIILDSFSARFGANLMAVLQKMLSKHNFSSYLARCWESISSSRSQSRSNSKTTVLAERGANRPQSQVVRGSKLHGIVHGMQQYPTLRKWGLTSLSMAFVGYCKSRAN